MEMKQPVFPDTLKPAEDALRGKNGSSKLSGQSTHNSEAGQMLEYELITQLQEIQELNIQLEECVVQQTKKLSEVTATNTKFISIIGHDLRSPFISILNTLEIVNESLNKSDINEIRKYICIASNTTGKALSLFDNLLSWTISQNREKNFSPVKINLYELVTDEIENIKASAAQKQIILEHTIAPDLNVSADLQMVRTILRNLICNAIKYTNTGGEIIINASEVRPFVEISVKDNGIGISFERKKMIFKTDKIQSADGTYAEKGTGLGLLLCREFVEIHGGKIWIDSEPGKGCEISFTLPHYL
jgi:two-component system sensor histidine kinase/response regulator